MYMYIYTGSIYTCIYDTHDDEEQLLFREQLVFLFIIYFIDMWGGK